MDGMPTATAQVAVLPLAVVAVIVAAPGALAVTVVVRLPSVTVATLVLLLVQLTLWSVALLGFMVAVRVSVLPIGMVVELLFRLTLATGTFTLTWHVAVLSAPALAVIVAVPGPTPVTVPVLPFWPLP